MSETNEGVASTPAVEPPSWISYGEFGKRFFQEAVTIGRIEAALEGMTGKGIKIGPVEIGPAGMAGFNADGSVGEPTITRHPGDEVSYDLVVPASLSIVLRLGQEIRLQVGVEINLVLAARPAAPLRIVIEIPKITHRDVKLVFRAEALGAMWQWLLEPMGEVIRREVATRLNAMLSEKDSMRSRIVDVAARINDTKENTDLSVEWISYDQFGERFFREAVTESRILENVSDLNGRKVEIGPLKAGPRGIAEVTAKGQVREPKVTAREPGEFVVLDLVIPLGLDLVIAMGKDNRYEAAIDIPLVLTARPADPLVVVIEVTPPTADQVPIELKSKGLRASLLGVVGGVKKEIAEQVASTVSEEVGDRTGRRVDIAERISGA
jgi:hypothetical protein